MPLRCGRLGPLGFSEVIFCQELFPAIDQTKLGGRGDKSNFCPGISFLRLLSNHQREPQGSVVWAYFKTLRHNAKDLEITQFGFSSGCAHISRAGSDCLSGQCYRPVWGDFSGESLFMWRGLTNAFDQL